VADPATLGGRAYAASIAQRLIGPAQALLGYQELIVEQVREAGPAEALGDLERVLVAARDLDRHLSALIEGRDGAPAGAEAEARLRHDLRTPINAILGYSELVVEEFAAELPPRLADDIETVERQARLLLEQIDAIVEHARNAPQGRDTDDADLTIATELARTVGATSERRRAEPGRILVVDDLKSNRDLLARRLRRDGHRVTQAASAMAALDILAQSEFDLLLVDILMPGMNGIELLRRVKADPRLHDVPVLMISGLKEEAAVLKCIAEGAEDYLPKPVDTVLLRARIAACLERRRWREQERRYVRQIQAEKERANGLLHAILPAPIVERLNTGETMIADRFESASIVFADIVNFSPLAARTSPTVLLKRLGTLFSRFDELAEEHGVEKIKTIGDAYMAAAGIPEPRDGHARSAVAFARAMMAEVGRDGNPATALQLRIGIHSGSVVAGLIGRKRFIYDVWGHTVNVASRLEASSVPGRIQVSHTTLEALGPGVAAEARGNIELKGIGAFATYLIAD
jgi:class 3 adenylate cyclase